jgi:hypothetical protein
LIVALLLASAPVMSAVDAERAFAADAQKIGQWSAFRKWAAEDAVMFAPQPVRAQAYLKDRKDPAKALDWWPTASYVSCDGSLAVNTGGWKAPGGAVGYFSTVWQRQKDGGWKWLVDGGDDLKVGRPHVLSLRQASCKGKVLKVEPALSVDSAGKLDGGRSDDGTLVWEWSFNSTGDVRVFGAYLWNGKAFVDVIDDMIPSK